MKALRKDNKRREGWLPDYMAATLHEMSETDIL